MNFNLTTPDVKKLKVRMPFELRRHPDFKNAQIRVDGDQIHFHLHDSKNDLPELWIYVAPKDGWVNVKFVVDEATNLQT